MLPAGKPCAGLGPGSPKFNEHHRSRSPRSDTCSAEFDRAPEIAMIPSRGIARLSPGLSFQNQVRADEHSVSKTAWT